MSAELRACRRCCGIATASCAGTLVCMSCAAAYLSVSPSTLARILKGRDYPAFVELPYGGRRFTKVDLDAFLARQRRAPRVLRRASGPWGVER